MIGRGKMRGEREARGRKESSSSRREKEHQEGSQINTLDFPFKKKAFRRKKIELGTYRERERERKREREKKREQDGLYGQLPP